MDRKGLICVLTGAGKGKTTAALGAAVRAAGQGLKVLILQFMKRQSDVGELKALGNLNLPIEIRQFGRRVFFKSRACEPMDIYRANQGLQYFQQAMQSGYYDMIILDEINVAVYFGLLEFEDLKRCLEKKPPPLHVILTGRNAKDELIEMADMVTEMKEIKHHYNQGVRAQRGIEF
jgi:cob(I)alamin adenosyltransferase